MDPVSQAVLGAAAAQAGLGRRLPRISALVGALSGMAADLDIYIGSPNDPLASMLWHRHFTHSLAFIPFGTLFCALVFLPWPAQRAHRRDICLASLLGYGTHGLLDACTSYGTVLLWPFTDRRISWDLIGIIDPTFTVVLLLAAIAGVLRRSRRIPALGLALALAYLLIGGGVQHGRAASAQAALAGARGHRVAHGRVMPSPGSLLNWRSVYRTDDGALWADAIRLPYIGGTRVDPGSSTRVVSEGELPATWDTPERRESFRIFSWFADGFTAIRPGTAASEGAVGDLRYVVDVHNLTPRWGLLPRDGVPRGVVRTRFGDTSSRPSMLRRMMESGAGTRPLAEVVAEIRQAPPSPPAS